MFPSRLALLEVKVTGLHENPSTAEKEGWGAVFQIARMGKFPR
jgi:hypothetical protein